MQIPITEIKRLEKAARSWPWIREEWTELPADCRTLGVALASKKIASLAPLLGLKHLEELHLCPVTAKGSKSSAS